jgi:hypothetical protein
MKRPTLRVAGMTAADARTLVVALGAGTATVEQQDAAATLITELWGQVLLAHQAALSAQKAERAVVLAIAERLVARGVLLKVAVAAASPRSTAKQVETLLRAYDRFTKTRGRPPVPSKRLVEALARVPEGQKTVRTKPTGNLSDES